jgi:hypothetical protein
MDSGDIGMGIFLVLTIGAVIAWVINDQKNKKKDREMLALLPLEEKNRILAERAEMARLKREAMETTLAQNREAQKRAQAAAQFGPINAAMVCPHCQTKGQIRTKGITQKKGVSGGKATAAVLTGGVSLLAVGLSRKEASTQAHCDSCNNTWLF